LQSFVQNIENIKADLRALNVQLEQALEHMPRNFDLAGLLRTLSTLATNSGLEISSFKPGTEHKDDAEFYRSVSIDFAIKGTYTQTLTFFDQLSRLKRIVNIEKLAIRQTGRSARVGNFYATTRATVRAFRFKD